MNITIFGLIGISLVGTSLVKTLYERRVHRQSADLALDRFRRLEAKQHQLSSAIAC